MNKLVSLTFAASVSIALLSSCSLVSGPPEHLKKGGVNIQQIALTRSTFAQSAELGTITDISASGNTGDIAVAGTLGAATLSRSGAIKSHVTYDKRADSVALIPTGSKTDPFKYLCTGSWAIQPRLYNSDGKTAWTVTGDSAANGTAYGIIDGKPCFAVGYNGNTGVDLLDASGNKLWNKHDSNVWQIAITSPTKTTPARIVHSISSGRIVVRDGAGVMVSKAEAPFYVDHFSLCRWPQIGDDQRLLACENGNICIFNLTGEVAESYPVPVDQRFGYCRGVSAHLKNSKETFLATVTSWKLLKRSMFAIHNAKGILLYEEVLAEACPCITVLPQGPSQPDALLIGGHGKIYKYVPAASASGDFK